MAIRGIIGDRVMVLFDSENCFSNAVRTAQAMNTVSTHIINRHFNHGEVSCGIGIDYGRMLVAKTGFRRHGVQRHNYRSLVWLGRPANVASKLTDVANKGASYRYEPGARVGSHFPLTGVWSWNTVSVQDFINSLEVEYLLDGSKRFKHSDPYVSAVINGTRTVEVSPATPPILMTQAVYDGFREKNPNDSSITNRWYSLCRVAVPGYTGSIYGGDVIFADLKPEL